MRGPAKITAVVAAALSAGVLGSGVAFAGWFESSPAVTVKKLRTVTMPGFDSRPGVQLAKNTVTVQWFAQKVAKGVPVQRYVVTRYNAVTGAHEQVCGASVTATKCKDTGVPVGTWEYTVQTALYRWTGPESRHSDPVTVAGPPAAQAAPTPDAIEATSAPVTATASPSPSSQSPGAQSPGTTQPTVTPSASATAPIPPDSGPSPISSAESSQVPPPGVDPDYGE